VDDAEVFVTVIAADRRDKNKVYFSAAKRLA